MSTYRIVDRHLNILVGDFINYISSFLLENYKRVLNYFDIINEFTNKNLYVNDSFKIFNVVELAIAYVISLKFICR